GDASGKHAVALNGDIHADYNAASRQIAFTRTQLRTPQTSINLNGTIAKNSSVQVELQSNDLSEIEMMVAVFHPTEPVGLLGKASFSGSVRGTTDNPQIIGQLAAAPLTVKGSEWRSLRTNVDLTPSLIHLTNGNLVPATRGGLNFDVSAELMSWSFANT